MNKIKESGRFNGVAQLLLLPKNYFQAIYDDKITVKKNNWQIIIRSRLTYWIKIKGQTNSKEIHDTTTDLENGCSYRKNKRWL